MTFIICYWLVGCLIIGILQGADTAKDIDKMKAGEIDDYDISYKKLFYSVAIWPAVVVAAFGSLKAKANYDKRCKTSPVVKL